MSETRLPRALIVEQSSARFQRDDLGLARRQLGEYVGIRKTTDLRREVLEAGDVISNLYNEHYGKMAVNLPDVIRGMTEKAFLGYLKKQGIDIDASTISGAQTRLIVGQATEKIHHNGYLMKKRELELAYDTFIQQFKTQADYEKHLQEGAGDFARLWSELRSEYLAEVRMVASELIRDLGRTDVNVDDFTKLFEEAFRKALKGEYERNRRKIAETRALLEVLESYAEDFSSIEHVLDMAGGAGDLGIAIADHYAKDGKQVRIIDVVPVLELYADYLKGIGLSEGTRDRVTFEIHPLQVTEIPVGERDKTAIVAKHPCGGLKEDIVNLAIQSEVPFLMIMTCCQDKMCQHAEEYYPFYAKEIPSREAFTDLLKRSAQTNIIVDDERPEMQERLEKKRQDGIQAMQILDTITANRLREAGYEVDMLVSDNRRIIKGNIIVARKNTKM